MKKHSSILKFLTVLFTLCLLLPMPPEFAAAEPGDDLSINGSLNSVSVQSDIRAGTATMTFPIAVPAGRHGMQPTLALTYNSNLKNGWLGAGWQLAGIGSIERQTKWGLDYTDEKYNVNGTELVFYADLTDGSKEFRAKKEGGFRRYIKRSLGVKIW